MKQRIFVVDDHAIVRDGYHFLLDPRPAFEVCGEASNVADALSGIEETEPDLVIVDISLEGMNGIELIKHLAARRPALPVLVVSMHDEALYAERALRAGASGYVMKKEVHATLFEAVRQVLGGNMYLSSRMNKKLLLQYMSRGVDVDASPVDRLTDRELETFELIGRGLTTRKVAEAMHISPKTVGTYRRRIKEKLALDDSAELVQRAVQWVQREAAAP